MDIKQLIQEQNTLVTIGLILIVVLGLLSAKLYMFSNYDNQGNKLGCIDTIRNIFGFLPILKEKIINNKDLSEDKNGEEEPINSDKNMDNVKVVKEKEVFNVDNSSFTYDEAKLICKAYGADLASYQQVVNAYEKGAHWCNYGWSKHGLGLFPTQEAEYEELQKNSDENVKKSCGKPGVNGGKFYDKNLKFGVNCYGFKPDADPSKIKYIEHTHKYNEQKHEHKKKENNENKELELVNKYKQLIEDGEIEIRPFNENKWSRYSYKQSTYLLTPKQAMDGVIYKSKDEDEIDPRTLNLGIPEEEELDLADVLDMDVDDMDTVEDNLDVIP